MAKADERRIDDYFIVNDSLVIPVGNEASLIERVFGSLLVDPRQQKKEKPSPASDTPYYNRGDILEQKLRKLNPKKLTSVGVEVLSRWIDCRIGSLLQRPNVGLQRYRERFINMFQEGTDMDSVDEVMEELATHIWRKVYAFMSKTDSDAWRFYFISAIDASSLMIEKNQDYRIIEYHRREIEREDNLKEGLVYKEGYYPL